MGLTKVFIFLLIFIMCEGPLGRSIIADPIHFEFHHQESLSISDTDSDVQEDDYDYEDPVSNDDPEKEENAHVRKRRSAKWSPNYDLYEQWAEEYYDQNKEPESAGITQPKGDLLDRLIHRVQNKTEEEIELERKEEQQRREILKNTFKYGTWVIGSVVVGCFAITIIKRFVSLFAFDFCNPLAYKKKITHMLQNFAPGVYVHKNGKKEYYTPTKEEMEALKDIQKLLSSPF